ncbi:MAG TPA: hypothetical protein VFG21_05690 [Xanthomonadaceae bacterium]|nr:hypothetical protein [Xanthomonadaceae bacterium]
MVLLPALTVAAAAGAGSATALRSGFLTPLDVDSLFSDGFEGATPWIDYIAP